MLYRNLVTALFQSERIQTTVIKAKEARSVAERLITFAKRGDLHARRMAARKINDPVVLAKLFEEIGPRYAERPGGYTRILRMGQRDGDAAHTSMLELLGAPAVKDKVLTTRETMAITDYLGNMLATRINKNPAALKGLLLVTFQGEQDEKGLTPLNFSDVIHAINHTLKDRLEQLGIKDAEAITKDFSEEVTRNQSVLLMMSV